MPGMGGRRQVKPAGGIRQKSRLQASLPGFSHRIPLAIGKTNRLHPVVSTSVSIAVLLSL